MADAKRKVDLGEIDSQLVITLYKGATMPVCECTVAGRMSGQMIMGHEGAGMMRIDNELRRAQVELRRATPGGMPPRNEKTLEERVMMTKENSSE